MTEPGSHSRWGVLAALLGGVAAVITAIVGVLAYLDNDRSATPAAPEKSASGSWQSVDPGDQSPQRLTITRSGTDYQVVLHDTLATTFCKTTAATVTMTGVYADHRLMAKGTLVCADGRRMDTPITITYTFHPDNDTLTEDISPAVWTRSP